MANASPPADFPLNTSTMDLNEEDHRAESMSKGEELLVANNTQCQASVDELEVITSDLHERSVFLIYYYLR